MHIETPPDTTVLEVLASYCVMVKIQAIGEEEPHPLPCPLPHEGFTEVYPAVG